MVQKAPKVMLAKAMNQMTMREKSNLSAIDFIITLELLDLLKKFCEQNSTTAFEGGLEELLLGGRGLPLAYQQNLEA